MTSRLRGGASGACVVLGVVLFAATVAAQQAETGFVHPRADEWFLQSAVADGLAELDLSMLGERQATDPRVRSFAQRLLATHTKAAGELNELARVKDIHVPTLLDARQQAEHDRLVAQTGAAFDRDLLAALIRIHEEQVDLFEHEGGSGLDAELRTMASRTLPSIREHLQEARNLK